MSPCSYAVLKKRAQALLAVINHLPQREWEQKLDRIYMSDEIQGPLVVAWMCQQMMKACPPKHAAFWETVIDGCKHAARNSHQIKAGWEAYGMTPYEVYIHRGYYKHPILPRYHSEPNLRYMLC